MLQLRRPANPSTGQPRPAPLCHESYSREFCPQIVRRVYRNFSVVSAKSAKIRARIQNRMMIFDSDQPISSKWW